MSIKNINNLLNFLDKIDTKLFKDVKNLDDIDHAILNKFKSLNKNLEGIEKIRRLNQTVKKIADEMNLNSKYIFKKYYFYKKLKII